MSESRPRSAKQLAVYFSLAYGLAWGGILAFLAVERFDFTAVGAEQLMVLLAFMLAGPSIAGLVLTATFDGRRGLAGLLRRLRRIRVGIRWYALALVPIPLLLLVVLVPLSIWVSPDYAPTLVAFGIAAGFLAGFFEEIGWTGFATPRLLERYSPLRAGLVLGLVWALWHALADFTGNIGNMGAAEWVVRMVVYWVVPLTSYRVLMTWAYAHHRSLLLAMVMHAGYTGWLATLTMEMPAATGPGALLWQALFATGVVVLTVAVVTFGRLAETQGTPLPTSEKWSGAAIHG